MELIIGRKGEQPFAITDKSVSGKHLKLTTLPDGNVQVEDLGSSNGTFIDGVRIIRKVVSRNTVIQMGSHYSFKISDVLPEAKSPSNQSQPTPVPKRVPEYSITHLKAVWDEYDNSLAEIREKSQKLAKNRMIPMMLGSASTVISGFVGIGAFITVPVAIISFYVMYKAYNEKDTSHEDTKSAKERLIKKYTCPNPDCHRTLPFKEYAILSQDPCCPYCKCKWTAK